MSDETDWSNVGGYDPELFMAEFDKDFLCPICTCVSRDPITLPQPCECVGRVFCHGCIRQLREMRCPTCRKPFPLAGCSPNRFVKGKVEAMKMKCPLYEQGCTATFILGKDEKGLKAHRTKCLYEETKCTDCKKLVQKKDMKAHADVECKMRYVMCEVCQQKFHVTKIQAHKIGPLNCDNCIECPKGCSEGKNLPIRKTELDQHFATCPMARVTCHVCAIELVRKDLPAHAQTKLSDHFTHLALRLIVLEEENKKLVQQNISLREEIKRFGVDAKYNELKALIHTLQSNEEKNSEGLSHLEKGTPKKRKDENNRKNSRREKRQK